MRPSIAPNRRVFVAVDTDDLDHAQRLAESVSGCVGGFKVGLQLFGRHGVEAVRRMRDFGDIFLDLKFHDIPNTVAGAASSIAAHGVRWFTVHASGGVRMMARGVEASREAAKTHGLDAPGALAVTVLTSHSDDEWKAIGWSEPCAPSVLHLTSLAREAGVAGIVCSPLEVAEARARFPEATLMVPGIRPTSLGVQSDDQSRVATPRSAVADGADLLVIGRPITQADDPRAAATAIAEELA